MKENTKSEYSISMTQTEIDILRLVGMGYTDREIAGKLGYTNPQSVKNRMGFIFSKLGAFNRVEAIVTAIEEGILGVDELAFHDDKFDASSLTEKQKAIADSMFNPVNSSLMIDDIARNLDMSRQSVKSEMVSVRRKLGLRNRVQGVALTLVARRHQQMQNGTSA